MKISTFLPEDIGNLMQEAERIGRDELAKIPTQNPKKFDEVKTHQVRNFYSSITKIRVNWRQGKDKSAQSLINVLILIKPKLAYAAARNTKIKTFYGTIRDIVDVATKELKQHKDDGKKVQQIYENFINLMEAIVAYHKFYLEN